MSGRNAPLKILISLSVFCQRTGGKGKQELTRFKIQFTISNTAGCNSRNFQNNVIFKKTVQGTEITVTSEKNSDYISLTDMAGYKEELEARVVVSNWMSTRYTLEFLGIWEEMYNSDFNRMEFHTIKITSLSSNTTK